MKVAVVVPVLNGREMVRECITACLSQTRPPDELFVIDNGSTDDTGVVARSAGATVIREPAPGSFNARNRGWRSANADVIAFTDVDCVPRPNWLADLSEPFVDPSVAAVGGDIVQAQLDSAAQRWMVERRFLDQGFNQRAMFLPYFATANAAYRRSTLEVIGGFDEAYVVAGGDTDLTWRVQELAGGRVVYRPEAAVDHFVGTGVGEITGRWHRYSAGQVVLERRWVGWPGFPAPPGFFRRTRVGVAIAVRARAARADPPILVRPADRRRGRGQYRDRARAGTSRRPPPIGHTVGPDDSGERGKSRALGRRTRRSTRAVVVMTREEVARFRRDGFVAVDRAVVRPAALAKVRRLLDALFDRADELPQPWVHDLAPGVDGGSVPEIVKVAHVEPRLLRTRAYAAGGARGAAVARLARGARLRPRDLQAGRQRRDGSASGSRVLAGRPRGSRR